MERGKALGSSSTTGSEGEKQAHLHFTDHDVSGGMVWICMHSGGQHYILPAVTHVHKSRVYVRDDCDKERQSIIGSISPLKVYMQRYAYITYMYDRCLRCTAQRKQNEGAV